MAYLDHSLFIDRAIRAKMAATPETSLPFVGNEHKAMPKGLMFSAKDYLQLVDDTGRIVRAGKRGSMSQESAKILNRLNIPQENWIKLTS